MRLLLLPYEIMIMMATYLTTEEIVALSCCHKSSQDVCDAVRVWSGSYKKGFFPSLLSCLHNRFRFLSVLDMKCCTVEEWDMTDLLMKLREYPWLHLQRLCLIKLNNDQMNILFQALINCKTVTSLELMDCFMTKSCYFQKMIDARRNWIDLCLVGIKCPGNKVDEIIRLWMEKVDPLTLQNINLSQNCVRNNHVWEVMNKLFSQSPNLESINLSRMSMTVSAFHILLPSILHARHLDLSYNRLNDDGIRVLNNAFRNTSHVRLHSLSLAGNPATLCVQWL